MILCGFEQQIRFPAPSAFLDIYCFGSTEWIRESERNQSNKTWKWEILVRITAYEKSIHPFSPLINKRLNCSFNPLTFTKLWFWSPKKKTTKRHLKFCICGSFGPQCQFWLCLRWRDSLNEVPRVIFFICFCLVGPKLLQMQNLGDRFVFFFLRGSKSQLCES